MNGISLGVRPTLSKRDEKKRPEYLTFRTSSEVKDAVKANSKKLGKKASTLLNELVEKALGFKTK